MRHPGYPTLLKKREEHIMKHTKRFASLLLAMVMVLAMAIPAFAAGVSSTGATGTITVDNPITGETYKAYKIFDVTYSDVTADSGNYSYTISTDSEWFATVQAYAANTAKGLTLTATTNPKVMSVSTNKTTFSAPDFAVALKEAVAGMTGGVELTADGTGVSAKNLELGYYFVSSTNGALCNLTTTNPTVTIHDKNDFNFTKEDDKADVQFGDVVHYTLTGKVPDTTGFTQFTYEISDTMSEGLTFKKDVVVKIDDTVITDAVVSYNVDSNANKFTVSIPVMNYQDKVAKAIEVTYSAEVNENAIAKVEVNHAILKFSNDPTNNQSHKEIERKENVYSAQILLDKYLTGNESVKLAGAKFVLYQVNEDQSKSYYVYNTNTKDVEWTADKAAATVVVTDENGYGNFNGLKNGTYYVEEIEAPAGYNLLTTPLTVTINNADNDKYSDPTSAEYEALLPMLKHTVKVANSTGTQLPATGGMGTTVFYIVGSALAVGAVVLLVTKKRMSNNG